MTMPADPSPGGLVAPSLGDSVSTVTTTAPELAQSPGLVVGVATSGGDTVGRSQAIARGAGAISNANAHNRVSAAVGGTSELTNALSWFGNHASQVGSDIVQGAKTAGSDAMKVLNAPLAQVQHEYRYLHDVEAKHGMNAAVLEGIGLAAGAAGELGAEAAGGIEGQLFYKDSWQRTASNSYVDPNNHQQVSMGRDIANFLDLGTKGTVPYRLSSGIIDGLFNLNTGGTELLGLTNEARSAK